MIKKFKHAVKNDYLISTGLIFMIGSGVGAVLNYLYHLFMGRMLGPEQYGILGTLFAIVYVVTLSTSAFHLVLSKFSAEFHSREEHGYLNYLIRRGLYKISIYGLVALGIYLLATPILAKFLNLDSISGLIIVGIAAYASLIASILSGSLNGLKMFKWQNISGIASTLLKFFTAIGLVYLGYKVNGALLAVLIGTIAGILITIFPLRNHVKQMPITKFDSKKVYAYFIPALIASILSVALITVDQLLVKHLLTSTDAGLYAAAGNIAKIIWFGSGFLAGAVFPQVVHLKAKGEDTSNILIKSIIYTAFLAIIGCLAYFIIPTFIVNIMYGSSYTSIAPIIGLFGVGMALFSINQILLTYNLALEKYGFIFIYILALAVEVVGMLVYHSSLLDIVKIFFASNLLISILFLIYNKKDFLGDLFEK